MTPSGSISDDIARPSERSGRPTYDGRLGVYAALGGYAGTIPLPWVPSAALHRIRGALVSDLAGGYGFSLTEGARESLSNPRGSKPARTLAVQALRMAGDHVAVRTLRTFGPMGRLVPLRGAFQTYALGRLFDRYLGTREASRGRVIDADEAARVRTAIDGALARAVTMGVGAGVGAGFDADVDPGAAWLDRTLQRVARIPSVLTRQLDAGFDDLIGS